jgi:hypothetical protein
MPYKSKQEGGVSKGKPSQTEKDKAAIKEVDDEKLERNEEMREKYADKDGNPDPDKVDIKHRNRNTNKPDIDKPAYGSSK